MATIQDIFDWLNQGAQGDIPGTGGEQPNAPAASQSAQPQATPVGDLLGFRGDEGDQSNRAYVPHPVPWTSPFPYDFYMPGQHQYREMQPTPQTPANEASAEGQDTGAQEAAARRRAYQAGQKAGQGLFGKPQQAAQQPKTIDVDPDATSNLDFSGIGNMLSRYHTIATGGGTPGDYASDIPAELLPHYQALVQGGLPPDVAKQILTQPSTAEGEGGDKSGFGWAYPYAGENQEAMSGLGEGRETGLDRWLDAQQQAQEINPPRAEDETLPMIPGTQVPDTSAYIGLPNGQFVPMPGATSGVGPWDLLNQYRSQGNPSSFYWNPQPDSWFDEQLKQQAGQ